MDIEQLLIIVGIIIIIAILLYNAYKQGYFTKIFGSALAKEHQKQQDSLQTQADTAKGQIDAQLEEDKKTLQTQQNVEVQKFKKYGRI